jgi:glyoxylase-like metal-dependent hydrolase (beta-lactamase superfamily II)
MKTNFNVRRILPLNAITLVLLLAACSAQEEEISAVSPAADSPPPPQFVLENVSGNVYRAGLGGGGGHTTVLMVTSAGIILADPIREDFAQWLKAELLERFNSEVEYVIYSHHHPDHASGGQVFADTATFVGHENMATNLTKIPSNSAPMDTNGNGVIELSEAAGGTLASFDRVDTNQDGVLEAAEINVTIRPLDLTYQDQLTISLGNSRVEVHHSPPAHSDDMSVILFPEDRVVFAVDFLQINRLPGGLTGFLSGYPVSDYEAAISTVTALEFDTIVQGHSELVGTKADVEEFANLLRATEAGVASAIAAGQDLEQTLESVMLPEYSDWLLYEVRREALVADMYRFQTQ